MSIHLTSWSKTIANNNPINLLPSGSNNTTESYWKIYCNNPIENPPNYNPSQWEFEIVYKYFVNKNRGFQIVDTGKKEFRRITKLTPNLTNFNHIIGFNFSK